ncbi:MAG: hypothetical protein M1400_00320 [Patescibacteria group bacterium]|nr:hypothetical protein [Patescibacteria group bacterium]
MTISRIQRLKQRFLLLGVLGVAVVFTAAIAMLFNPDVAWHGQVKHCRLAVTELAKSLYSGSQMPVLVRRDEHLGSACPDQVPMNLPRNITVPISIISVAHPVVTEFRFSDDGLVCTYHWDSITEPGMAKTAKELKPEDYDLVLGNLGRQKYQQMPTFGPGAYDLSRLNLAGYQKFARIAPNAKEFFRNVPRVYYYNRGSAYEPPGFEQFDENLRSAVQSAQFFSIASLSSMAVFGLPLVSLGLMGVGRLYAEYCKLSYDGWIMPLWPFIKSSDLALDDEIWRSCRAKRLKTYFKSRRKTQEEQRQLERANLRLRELLYRFPEYSPEYQEALLAMELALKAVNKQPIAPAASESRTDRINKLIATLERITNPKYRHEISGACAQALALAETDYRQAKAILAEAHRIQSARNREDKYDPRLAC